MLRELLERFKYEIASNFVVPPMLVEPGEEDIRRHAIVISHNGIPIPILTEPSLPLFPKRRTPHRKSARPQPSRAYLGRSRRQMTPLQYQKYLNGMIENLRQWYRSDGEHKGVIINIHGGNADPRKSLRTSIALRRPMLEDGYYPIFICWDSNLRRAYNQQLFSIRSGLYDPDRGLADFLYFLCADIARGVALLYPAVLLYGSLLRRSSRWSGCPTTQDLNRYQSPEVHAGAWRPGLSFLRLAKIPLGSVAQFAFVLPWSLVITGRAWENLLRRTRAMFRAPREFDPRLAHRTRLPDGRTYHPCEGAMALFLDALAEAVARCGDMPVTLIAHSMGSMIANEVLRYRGELPYESLVYMAPACSVREFEEAVDPVIRKRDGRTEAYVLTLHPKVEAGLQMRGFIVGSALEWLEGLMTPPNTYLDRMLGKWENALRTCHIYRPEVRSHIHIKCFPYDGGAPTKPYDHAHFNDPDVAFWRRSFWLPDPPGGIAQPSAT